MKKPMRIINNGGVVYYEATPADYVAERKMPVVKFENSDSLWVEADEMIKVLEEGVTTLNTICVASRKWSKFRLLAYLESIKRIREWQAEAAAGRITEWEVRFERDVS